MNFIDSIKEIDTQLFLFLNGKHNVFFDNIMFFASKRLVWIPLYLYFLYLAVKYYRKNFWLILVAAFLTILLSDQISVQAFKYVFLRYRPCHNILIQDMIHLNGGCGGAYGFISSHAANTFALAMLLSLFFRNNIKYFGVFIFLWAAFVSYSRIYNGVHYPADVAVGAIVGIGIGISIFKVCELLSKKVKSLQNYGNPNELT